jgi:hypothetical protein
VSTDPPDRAAQLREAAISETDLPHRAALLAGKKPPENFSLQHRPEHGDIIWTIKKTQKACNRVQELG